MYCLIAAAEEDEHVAGPTPAAAPGRRAPQVVAFDGPRAVAVVPEDVPALLPGGARVRTLFSGISAGTEMTAYRGSNPYLTKHWDARRRLFTAGTASFEYPVVGWGYSEVGEVVEVAPAPDAAPDPPAPPEPPLAVGDVVFGVWGHRSEAVLPAATLAANRLPPGVHPVAGVFARVGAIALNAVLAADVHLGEVVAVFGQGVLGLIATRLAVLSGATVVAVDALAPRLALARTFGAANVVDATAGPAGEAVKALAPAGVDVAVEISGSYRALHEATRAVAPGGRVVAAGFYQGGGAGLSLGEEFHHNRVQILSSQIGAVPTAVAGRWTRDRLHQVVMALVADGRLDVAPLVTHVVPLEQAAHAYRLLDEEPADTLQVVLDFGVADPGAAS